jgi:hypothetical protein
MRIRPTHFFLAIILVTSFFAAGTADVLFGDVIPIRPYDTFFKWTPQFQNGFQQAAPRTAIGSILTLFLIILIVASTAASVANSTTGIVTAHQGFTPNINLTSSPGLKAAVPVLPLIFIGIGIGYALDEMGGIL